MRRDCALTLAARGLRVFPVRPGAKIPFDKGWQTWATSDSDVLRQRWNGRFEHHNVGVATGQGLLVLDADTKGGKRGLESLDTLDLFGLPASFRVRTPSGGVHVYLNVPGDISITVSVNALRDYPDIDVRCEGGLVVGPGSELEEGEYRILNDAPIEPAPDWLLVLLKRARLKAVNPASSLQIDPKILDSQGVRARAIEYLTHSAPHALEGEGGDETTYKVAARLRDFGLSAETAFELISEHWNEAGKASPPWDPEELQRKVANAYEYATGAIGKLSGIAEFGSISSDQKMERPKKEPGRSPPLDYAEIEIGDEPPELIEGYMIEGALAVVYGISNSGKTFVASDIGHAVASGRSWNGRVVASGLVFYVAAEGGHGIKRRFKALRLHFKDKEQKLPFVLWPVALDLLNSRKDGAELVQQINDAAARFGQPPKLIVLDTLSRLLAGGDENASTDMGVFVRNIDRIRAGTGAAVLLVGHTGKDETKGLRGWSGLRAAVDTEISIALNTVRVTKQRDMDFADDLQFRLQVISVGTDTRGKPITSCVVDWHASATADFERVPLAPAVQKIIDVLRDLIEVRIEAEIDMLEKQRAVEQFDQDIFERRIIEIREQEHWIPVAEWNKSLVAEHISALARRAGHSSGHLADIGVDKRGNMERHFRRLRTEADNAGWIKKNHKNQWTIR